MALHLDDDDATLAAALALIDEWERESVAAETISVDANREDETDDDAQSSVTAGTDSDDRSVKSERARESAPAPAAPIAAVASRRRKMRSDESPVPMQLQRRDELVFLRRTVRELESHLALTQLGKESEAVGRRHSHVIDAAYVWKQIANRQHQHRQTSEVENTRLRVKLQEQVAIAKQLMGVLLRAYRAADSEEQTQDEPAKRLRRTRGDLAEVSEEDQLQRIDELRMESEGIFAARPFTGGPPIFRDVRVLEHDNGEATINVDSSWVLPYPVNQVMSAFWTYLIRKTERRDCGFENCTEETRDILVTPYESNEAATRLVGKFVGRFVARRILPRDDNAEALMLWDMRAEPVSFKPMSMDGVRIHNETTMRVVWADRASGITALKSDVSGRMALVQMSQRVHVQFAASETPTRCRRVGALTNYLFYTVESELDWKQQMLETLLLRLVPLSAPVESWTG